MGDQKAPRVRPVPTPRVVLCPFCGGLSANLEACTHCKGRFDPLSRQASQNAMGPWFIRDERQPFAPGCSFETVKNLIARGRISKNTIIRGPTTNQFWTLAKRTPGVANLLGVCHNCQHEVSPKDFACGACGAPFTPEVDRQHLGLAPLQPLPGQAPPAVIAALSGPPVGVEPIELDRLAPAAQSTPPASDHPRRREPSRLPERVVSSRADDTRMWLMLAGAMVLVILLGAVFGPELARRLGGSPAAVGSPPVSQAGGGQVLPIEDEPGGVSDQPAARARVSDRGGDGTVQAARATPDAEGPSGKTPDTDEEAEASSLLRELMDLIHEDSERSLETARGLLRTEAVRAALAQAQRERLEALIDRRLRRETVRRLP